VGPNLAAGHRLAIPTAFWKQKTEIMARQKKPRAILAKRRALERVAGRAFVPTGNGLPEGIWARLTKARLPIVRLFTFEDSAHIKGVLHFEDKGKRLSRRQFRRQFFEGLRPRPRHRQMSYILKSTESGRLRYYCPGCKSSHQVEPDPTKSPPLDLERKLRGAHLLSERAGDIW